MNTHVRMARFAIGLVALSLVAGDRKAETKAEPQLPAVGDRVVIRLAIVQPKTRIAASATLANYKELDAYFGSDPKRLFGDTSLPSGAQFVPVIPGTQAVLLELREPDGVLNDSLAARVRVMDGDLANRALWVRATRISLSTTPLSPTQLASDRKAMMALREAERLEKVGRDKQALEFYRYITVRYPGTPAAALAADRRGE